MRLLEKLERRLRRFAIPQLTRMIVIGQLFLWVLGSTRPGLLTNVSLLPDRVLDGEFWRLITFVFYPPGAGVLALFGIYMFWLMGTALEAQWGDFRYNAYLLIAYLATIGSAFVFPESVATNAYLEGSVFLAFAFLFPDFVLYIFFVLPVKIKWLALLTWIGYGFQLIFGSWPDRVLVLAAVLNFVLFFGVDIYYRGRHGKRQMERTVQRIKQGQVAFHTCSECGVTELQDRQMDFRFCSQCDGNHEFCSAHLTNHEHRQAS